ncbi:hypothetical protein ABCR94_06525 [Streptomyces sp. 21So2-11]|uniref:hypothetical protein n=1 Tax=Streptomyces sp. 21So2-11 TaxID=3144408 RepID=UPI00321AB168
MKRRTLPAAAAFAATAALLLTACGGGDEKPEADDKIAGAEQGDKKSASPSATPSKADGRPKIELPPDDKLVFVPEKTGHAVKDAVLADNAERMRASDAAITGKDPKYVALNFYNSGRALEAAAKWVEGFKTAGLTVTGTVRFHDRNVTLNKDGSASLTYCADESKGSTKKIKTGKVDTSPPNKDSYVFYNTRLEKNSDGVWQTTRIISSRGAAQCQP